MPVIENNIKKILENYTSRKYLKKWNLNLRLRQDLGIDGEDAIDFLNDYQKAFGIKLPDFVFSDYFNSEADFFFWGLFSFWKKKPPKDFTINDLIILLKTPTQSVEKP
jgi:acyl carrier protein